uniref:Apolipoprotein Ea n=1 Tax=Sander lucioperca TaxID=283035 RepID=A0A8C9X6W8_SANLU
VGFFLIFLIKKCEYLSLSVSVQNLGCHARSVPDDEEKNPWEVTVDKFNEYLTKADEVVKNIKSSQISRELDTLIQDSMAELAMYKDDLQTKLAPFTQDAAETLGKDLQELFNRLGDHMSQAREQMEKYAQELQTMMELNADDVSVRISAYTRKLKKRLNKDTQDIKRVVADFFEELQSRTSNNMEDMKTRLDPYFAHVRDNAQAKITTLNDLLKSQVENFEKTAEDLRSTLEEKWKELKSWFTPVVSMFSDNM